MQRFDFRRISTADLATHLASVVEREGVAVEPDALQLLARAAQGGVRDGLSLLDQAISAGQTPVTAAVARRALGLTDPALLFELMRALAGADAAAALRAAATAFAAGADPRQLLRDVARLSRAAELNALGYPEGAEVTAEEAALAADLGTVAPPGFWLTGLELFAEAEMNMRQPVDARLQVELCLLRMLRPPASATEDTVLTALDARVAALERIAHDGASTTPPASATPAPAPVVAEAPNQGDGASTVAAHEAADFTLERWKAEWSVIIDSVTRVDTMLAGVLRDCRPVEAGSGRLVIGTTGKFHMDTISKPEKTGVIADAATSVAGAPVAIETRFTGSARPAEQTGTVSDVTQAVLQTFSGSRVVATRLRDDAGAPSKQPDDA